MAFRTQGQVDKLRLPAGKSEHWEFDQDTTGLSIRLQGRARSWIVWYAVNGRRRKVKIGDVAGLKLDQARRKATEIVNGAKDGKDTLAEREATKAKAADTLGALINIYLERRAKPRQRPRTYAETERYLLKRWAPLHDRPVDGITRKDIAQRLERIRTENGPTAANHARVYLSGCFSWAMRQGLAAHNPVSATEAPAAVVKRDRVLQPGELAEVWRACADDDFGRVVRLLMLLGQRREEIAAMAWSELDLDRGLWVIPSTRTKNKREHEVAMPDQALALLPEKREHHDLVFGRGKRAFSGFSKSKERLDQRIACRRAEQRLGRSLEKDEKPETKDRIEAWRLHDLRHSFVTHAAELGIDPHTIESCINHMSGTRGGIAGRYNHSLLREPKRIAMQRFADWLEGVVTGKEPASNVVALR